MPCCEMRKGNPFEARQMWTSVHNGIVPVDMRRHGRRELELSSRQLWLHILVATVMEGQIAFRITWAFLFGMGSQIPKVHSRKRACILMHHYSDEWAGKRQNQHTKFAIWTSFPGTQVNYTWPSLTNVFGTELYAKTLQSVLWKWLDHSCLGRNFWNCIPSSNWLRKGTPKLKGGLVWSFISGLGYQEVGICSCMLG